MALLTATTETSAYTDQARELRRLVAQRALSSASSQDVQPQTCRSLAIIGGKGGVGKSVIALNLAIALARQGAATALLDASPGAGHLSLLCGQNGYWNLEHVSAGTRTLDEITLMAPRGVKIIPGAHHLLQQSQPSPMTMQAINTLERQNNWIIVDVGSAASDCQTFAAAADRTLIVTTPEPTSVAGAYATIKMLAASGIGAVSVMVNQADTSHQAEQVLIRLRHATRAFLGSDIGLAGWVPHDPAVSESVFNRVPFASTNTGGPAQVAIDQLEQRLNRPSTAPTRGFTEGLRRQLRSVHGGPDGSAA